MKKKKVAKVLKYTAVFEPAEEGGYVVTVPSLPGCITEGDTFEQAVEMVKDAIKGYLSVLKDERQEVPREIEDIIITRISVAEPIVSL